MITFMEKPAQELRVTLRIPGPLAAQMAQIMQARGITNASDFVRQAIRRLVDEESHALTIEETRRALEIHEARAQYGAGK